MAERTTKYKESNIGLRVPDINFAGQRQAIQASKELSNSFLRMSNFLMRTAEQFAPIAGAEYGAEQIPTKEQLADIVNSGQQIDIKGSKFTAFGQAARKTQLDILTDELSTMARTEITNITTQASLNETTPSQVALQIDEVIAGFGSVLDKEDPGFARQFRANLGLYGNAEYKTYANQQITKQQKNLAEGFTLQKLQVYENLEKIIETGKTQIPGKEPVALSPEEIAELPETLQTIKTNLLRSAENVGNYSVAQLNSLNTEFDSVVNEAAYNVLAKVVSETDFPHAVIQDLQKGISSNPIIQNALKIVDYDKKATLISRLRATISDKYTREQQNNQLVENARKDKEVELEEEYATALIDYLKDKSIMPIADANLKYNQAKAKISQDMVDVNPEKAREIFNSLPQNLRLPETSDGDLVQKIETDYGLDAATSKFNYQKLKMEFESGKLTLEDYKRFNDELKISKDKNYKEAVQIMRNTLNLSLDTSFIQLNSQGNRNARTKALGRALNELITAKDETAEKQRIDKTTPDFDPKKWVEEEFPKYYIPIIKSDLKGSVLEQIKDLAELGPYRIQQALSGPSDLRDYVREGLDLLRTNYLSKTTAPQGERSAKDIAIDFLKDNLTEEQVTQLLELADG